MTVHGIRCVGLVAVFSFASAAMAATPSELAGTWSGTWTKGGDALPVEVTFVKAAGYSGSFDSSALRLAGIPFSVVNFTRPKVHFVLQGDDTSVVFEGRIAADTLKGTFKDGATPGTFRLMRSAHRTPTVQSRDVTFQNGAVSLSGTLLLPAGAGPHPGIVFLHGSGPEGRWANRYLAQKLAENGVVALVYDKRGVGKSTGDWKAAGFEELAGDAEAGIQFLRGLSTVNPDQIGIYGHSQGGTIAPLVAVRDGRLGFIIGASASGVDPPECEIYSVDNSIGVRKLAASEAGDARMFVRELVDVAYRGKNRDGLDAMAAKFKERSWYFEPPAPKDFWWGFSRRIGKYDPPTFWAQVRAPVLLLYGGLDERVPPKQSADAIAMALRNGGNKALTLRTFPTGDHSFRLHAKKGGWPRCVPNYDETIVAWVRLVNQTADGGGSTTLPIQAS